jgi:hypothetical protein
MPLAHLRHWIIEPKMHFFGQFPCGTARNIGKFGFYPISEI